MQGKRGWRAAQRLLVATALACAAASVTAAPAVADIALDAPPVEAVAEVADTVVPPAGSVPSPDETLTELQSDLAEPVQGNVASAAATVETTLTESAALLPAEDAVEVVSVPALPAGSEPSAPIAPQTYDETPSRVVVQEDAAAADAPSAAGHSARPRVERARAVSNVEAPAARPRMTTPAPVSLHDPSARSVEREASIARISEEARLLPVLGHDLWRPGAWSAPPRAPTALVVAMLLGILVLSPPIAGWLRLGGATAPLHPADVRFRLARPG